jgi:hypothetical protein
MKTTATSGPDAKSHNVLAAGMAVLIPCGVAAVLWRAEPWALMWGLAAALFLVLKILTARTEWDHAGGRLGGYVFLWPGMDARAFFSVGRVDPAAARPVELAWAITKLAAGALACGWAAQRALATPSLAVAWVGMVGIVFVLHFGGLHIVSWCWRRAGVDAPPIMRAPIAAESLAEFWGGRWNAAFADAARRLLLRPLARRWGVNGAGAGVFLVSGLVHELVISLPARGGWGGPTLYFLLQGAGMAVEKSRVGRRIGLGAGIRGWLWTLLCTALPLPLLFHPPFARRVILPFFQFLHGLLP